MTARDISRWKEWDMLSHHVIGVICSGSRLCTSNIVLSSSVDSVVILVRSLWLSDDTGSTTSTEIITGDYTLDLIAFIIFIQREIDKLIGFVAAIRIQPHQNSLIGLATNSYLLLGSLSRMCSSKLTAFLLVQWNHHQGGRWGTLVMGSNEHIH